MLAEVVRLLWGAGGAIYGQFAGKRKANEIYRYVVPELKSAIDAGHTLKDDDVKKAVKILEDLAPFGTKRRNFSRKYLEDELSIQRLPDNPDQIMFGYWW